MSERPRRDPGVADRLSYLKPKEGRRGPRTIQRQGNRSRRIGFCLTRWGELFAAPELCELKGDRPQGPSGFPRLNVPFKHLNRPATASVARALSSPLGCPRPTAPAPPHALADRSRARNRPSTVTQHAWDSLKARLPLPKGFGWRSVNSPIVSGAHAPLLVIRPPSGPSPLRFPRRAQRGARDQKACQQAHFIFSMDFFNA